MAWVIFSAPHSWDPPEKRGRTTLTFEAGPEPRQVRRDCADAAIARGRATEVPAPARDAAAPGEAEPAQLAEPAQPAEPAATVAPADLAQPDAEAGV